MNSKPEFENRLIHEKSPYLLQHARNPVDWHPWGDEAFQLAQQSDKPVFLSIGYSTCHWCHVMEHESFEDPEVARLMNDAFVNIKVDREERPDIDASYMSVCQMMTGSGGWPLTLLLTPDRKPFFAGTYFPKESRYGRIGMLDLIPKAKVIWRAQHNEILETVSQIQNALKETEKVRADGVVGAEVLQTAYEELERTFDAHYGGFGTAPKFPTPHRLTFLFRYWSRTGEKRALEMAEKTLQAARLGGLFDQVGFGFHRYSTDEHWLLPHFEKMLYDQALLLMAYTEAYQITKKEEYRDIASKIIEYVLRDLTNPEGAFCCAEDADSEGIEGKFYLWTESEIRQVLSPDEADLVHKVFNIRTGGNFADEATHQKTGQNILYLQPALCETAKRLSIDESRLKTQIDVARRKLFDARAKRVRPSRDDKVLTDWNGLTIAALAKAARVFDEKKYLGYAERGMRFIDDKMRREDGKLLHRYRDGDAAIRGFLDDYAFMIWALLELYETTFDAKYLKQATELNGILTEQFWDHEFGGFFFTSTEHENLLVRMKEIYDGAVPSGNSIAMLNLLRLARLTGRSELEDMANKIPSSLSGTVTRFPSAHTQLMSGIDFSHSPSLEVIVVGDPDSTCTKEMFAALNRDFLPNKVVLFVNHKNRAEVAEIAAFTRNFRTVNGKATAYVCQNYSCQMPTNDPDHMLAMLKSQTMWNLQ